MRPCVCCGCCPSRTWEMSGWERGWCCSTGAGADVSGCGRVVDMLMPHQVPMVGAPYWLSSCRDAPTHAGCSIVFHHPEPCCGQESLPQEWRVAMRVLTHPSRCHNASTGEPCKTPPGAGGLLLCFKALPELLKPKWMLRQKYQPGRVMGK